MMLPEAAKMTCLKILTNFQPEAASNLKSFQQLPLVLAKKSHQPI